MTPFKGVNITLGMLCYNTKEHSIESYSALVLEAEALKYLGAHVSIVVVDNGRDGTYQSLIDMRSGTILPTLDNLGCSRGRNIILNYAESSLSDYVFLLDGDIRPVSGSLRAMLIYMIEHPHLGCLSAHPVRQTTDSEIATTFLDRVHTLQNDVTSACTGYAMFNGKMLKDGIRLDESGPFGGPGWGYEDDDLYWQMITAGWEVSFFTDMVYLQRQMRSSWPSLLKDGVSVSKMFELRKEYFLEKWKKKGLNVSILLTVEAQHLPGDYDEERLKASVHSE